MPAASSPAEPGGPAAPAEVPGPVEPPRRRFRWRRWVTLAVVLGVVAAAVGAGCQQDPAHPNVDHPRLRDVRSFALALGVDPLDTAALDRLGRYDLVVVDGSATATQVAGLHRRGALVLGYLSVGTVEPYRPWYDTAREEGWLLDRYDDWDEWYVDTSDAGFRSLILDEARRQVAVGFDGLFLDNTDMVAEHPDQATGMTRLVADLDSVLGARRILFAQNGDATVRAFASHLDGWNREDVSSTYDFDRDRYAAVPADERTDAQQVLRVMDGSGILATATDYVGDRDLAGAGRAIEAACDAGAVPFVSDIDLARIPATPPHC